MRKLMLNSLLFIFLLACATNPTEKQKEFAEELLQTPGILKTEWTTNLSIWIQVDLHSLGQNPKLNAQQLADQIATAGVNKTQKDICVNIYFGDLNQLASSCLNK